MASSIWRSCLTGAPFRHSGSSDNGGKLLRLGTRRRLGSSRQSRDHQYPSERTVRRLGLQYRPHKQSIAIRMDGKGALFSSACGAHQTQKVVLRSYESVGGAPFRVALSALLQRATLSTSLAGMTSIWFTSRAYVLLASLIPADAPSIEAEILFG